MSPKTERGPGTSREQALPEGLTPEKIVGYLDRRADDVAGISSAIRTGDRPEAREQIRAINHRIKGNAALYCLPELGKLAGEALAAADGSEWSEVVRSATAVTDRIQTEKHRWASPGDAI